MKTTALIIIITLCSSIGVLKNLSLKNRVRQLCLLRDAVEDIRVKIELEKLPISAIFAELSGKSESVLIRDMAACENGIYTAYKSAENKNMHRSDLKKTDWQIFDRFFSVLGKSGSEQQHILCEQTSESIRQKILEAEKDCEKYGKLSLQTGFLAGLFITAIFI